jgi:hypothetical protein
MPVRTATKRTIFLILAWGIFFIHTHAAHGQVSTPPPITYSYVPDPSTAPYTTNGLSSSITINVYLQETLTGGSQSLIAADSGLFGAAIAVYASGSTVSLTSATNSTNFPNNVSTAPPFQNTPPAGQVGSIIEIGPFTSGPTSSTKSGGTTTNLYLLGSLTFTGTTTVGATTFTLEPYSSLGGYTTTNGSNGYYDLDITDGGVDLTNGGAGLSYLPAVYSGAGDNPTSFTINSVPEPGSLALCALAFSGAAGATFWRRRKGADAVK